MKTVLFFDSFYLNRWENLRRCVGHPELVPEATFVDPDHMIAVGYPAVFRDGAGTWRCLYQGMPAQPGDESRQRYPLVAESDDGMSWKIPDLAKRVPLPDRRYPHQVLPAEVFGQWNHYVDKRAEDPEKRIKGLVQFPGGKTSLWTSADGLVWSQEEGVEWCRNGPDTPANAVWSEARQSYVLLTRPRTAESGGMYGPRRYAVSDTRDWRRFGEPELALMCDSADPPLAELYGLPVFPYEGMYIGLMWIYNTVPYRPDDPKTMNKYFGGKVDCQLAYSYNGWHFQRSLREPFIPNAPTGEFGAGVLHPTTLMVDNEHSIRIYSSSSKVEHGYHDWLGDWETDLGAILMHRLRLDGFMYLESAGGLGILGTRPLFWRGGDLRLNVQSEQEVRVQVTEISGSPIEGYSFGECEPFSGDELFWQPRWQNRRTMADLAKRVLRLEISLENARIYAIRGDFFPLSAGEARRITETGEEPDFSER